MDIFSRFIGFSGRKAAEYGQSPQATFERVLQNIFCSTLFFAARRRERAARPPKVRD
jgi:hypothetical protein